MRSALGCDKMMRSLNYSSKNTFPFRARFKNASARSAAIHFHSVHTVMSVQSAYFIHSEMTMMIVWSASMAMVAMSTYNPVSLKNH